MPHADLKIHRGIEPRRILPRQENARDCPHALDGNATNVQPLVEYWGVLYSQGVSSFGSFNETSIGRDILEFSNTIFDKCEKRLLNKIEVTLSNLNDTNVGSLSQISMSPTPDRQCEYSMTSVFKNMDANQVFGSIQNLSNSSIMEFCQFLRFHYKFGFSLGPGCNQFQNDLNFLQNLQSLVKQECSNRKSVDSYVFTKLSKHIDGAISRASGNNEPVCQE